MEIKKTKYRHGTAHGNSLFNQDQLFQIRQYSMAGYRTSAIAMRFKCNVTTIQRILAGKTYKNEHKNAPVSQAGAR
jgi:DNA invertase Pin-like site-specific DNA recombinase